MAVSSPLTGAGQTGHRITAAFREEASRAIGSFVTRMPDRDHPVLQLTSAIAPPEVGPRWRLSSAPRHIMPDWAAMRRR